MCDHYFYYNPPYISFCHFIFLDNEPTLSIRSSQWHAYNYSGTNILTINMYTSDIYMSIKKYLSHSVWFAQCVITASTTILHIIYFVTLSFRIKNQHYQSGLLNDTLTIILLLIFWQSTCALKMFMWALRNICRIQFDFARCVSTTSTTIFHIIYFVTLSFWINEHSQSVLLNNTLTIIQAHVLTTMNSLNAHMSIQKYLLPVYIITSTFE